MTISKCENFDPIDIEIWFFDTHNTFYLIVRGLKNAFSVSLTPLLYRFLTILWQRSNIREELGILLVWWKLLFFFCKIRFKIHIFRALALSLDKNQPGTMKNHENQPGPMKTNEKPWKTLKNHEKLWKTMKNHKNHEKPWKTNLEPWKTVKNHEKSTWNHKKP